MTGKGTQGETGTKRPKKTTRRTAKEQSKAKTSRLDKKPKPNKELLDPEVNLELSFPAVIDALLKRGKEGSHLAAKAAVELMDKLEERKLEGGVLDKSMVVTLLERLEIDPGPLMRKLKAGAAKDSL